MSKLRLNCNKPQLGHIKLSLNYVKIMSNLLQITFKLPSRYQIFVTEICLVTLTPLHNYVNFVVSYIFVT